MLVAVNCGRSQSPSLVLSRRRSMRRLRLASLRCKVAFTRNPSGLRVLETPDTLSNPRKAERFRVFHGISSPTNGGFALLRARHPAGTGAGLKTKERVGKQETNSGSTPAGSRPRQC